MYNLYIFIVFILVYSLIAIRKIKSVTIPSWLAMLIGAAIMLAMQTISIEEAYASIEFDVILFLLGMFIVVSAVEVSGLLHMITLRILKYAKSIDRLILFILVVMGTLSAFLMNDTIALVATPILLSIARTGINAKPLLITLAFAVTIGSTMTPIGNPQNYLIAVESGIKAPMIEFLKYLTLPTVVNYIVTYMIVKAYFRRHLNVGLPYNYDDGYGLDTVKVDDRLAGICKVVVSLMIITFFIVNVGEALGYNMHIDMSHIAVAAALVLLVLTGKRFTILRNVNYGIIVLFIAMFIFMHALAKTSFIDTISSYLLTTGDTLLNIVSASVILSQFMSNVPFVAFYINVMHVNGLGSENIKEWITLAGASTLAGNLTILGAASNLIILEEASKRRYSFTFLEFFKVGSIVTAANIAVLLSFIIIIP